MQILNVVLLLGIAESKLIPVKSSTTSENPPITTTTKSKRDQTTSLSASNTLHRKQFVLPYTTTYSSAQEDLSKAETTVNTNPAQNHPQSVTYSPYQFYEGNLQNQKNTAQFSSVPIFQGGFQASHVPNLTQRGAQNAYIPTTYAAQPNQQFQAQIATIPGLNSEYYTNPSSYRIIAEPTKSSAQIRPTTFTGTVPNTSYTKFKSNPNASNRQAYSSYEDHSFESHPKFRFQSTTPFNTQSSTPLISSFPRSKSPLYKSASYPSTKNLDPGPTSYSTGLSSADFKSFEKVVPNYQYGSVPSKVGYSAQKVNLGSLQGSPELSGYVQAFEAEPVLIDYQAHPSSNRGLDFDFPSISPSSLSDGSVPFTSTIGNYQSRILPVHSSSSTAQLPQYKGASINTFASNDFPKPSGGYQLLSSQPQLHFTTGTSLQSVSGPGIYHGGPLQQIRGDVEVINKKRPISRPDDSDEIGDGKGTIFFRS